MRVATSIPILLFVSWAGVVTADAQGTSLCAGNPNALGLARTVEVDTTGGPGLRAFYCPMEPVIHDQEPHDPYDNTCCDA